MRFKKLRTIIVQVLLELDYDKIKFDEDDLYYALDRKDYLYCGISHKERMKMSKEMDIKMKNKRPKVIFKEK